MIFHDMYLIETNESMLDEILEKNNIDGDLEVDFQTAQLTFECGLFRLEIECDTIESAENNEIIAAFENEKLYVFSAKMPAFVPEIIKEESNERY